MSQNWNDSYRLAKAEHDEDAEREAENQRLEADREALAESRWPEEWLDDPEPEPYDEGL